MRKERSGEEDGDDLICTLFQTHSGEEASFASAIPMPIRERRGKVRERVDARKGKGEGEEEEKREEKGRKKKLGERC